MKKQNAPENVSSGDQSQSAPTTNVDRTGDDPEDYDT